jgi:hypothetical protein
MPPCAACAPAPAWSPGGIYTAPLPPASGECATHTEQGSKLRWHEACALPRGVQGVHHHPGAQGREGRVWGKVSISSSQTLSGF